MARKASEWIENWRDSASHMGVLDELYEHVHGLGELEEQLGESVEDCLGLGESVLGIGELGRRTPTSFG